MAPLPDDAVLAGLSRANVPGAAVIVVDRGQIEWARGYGLRRAGSDGPVGAETVFGAASVSKWITAVMVLGLQEAGLVDLDADIAPMLPRPVEIHPVAGSVEGRTVTLRQLLAHRAGVVGRGTTPRADGRGFAGKGIGGGSPRFPIHDVAARSTSRWIGLTSAPGTMVSYSGAGYRLVEQVIERATGMSFAEVADDFFAAIGATSASFHALPNTAGNFAWGHGPDGTPLAGGHEYVAWPAAGGLYCSALDLGTVLNAVLEHNLFEATTRHLDVLRGSSVNRQRRGTFTMGGDNGGFRAVVSGDVERKRGAAVLTNGRGNAGVAVRNELLKAALG